MKYGMVVVLLIASATAQDKLTAKQCRADLGKWVPMFKATYAAAECQGDGRPNCPFVDPIRTLQSAQLVNIATEAEECIKLDSKKNLMVGIREKLSVNNRMDAFMTTTWIIPNSPQDA